MFFFTFWIVLLLGLAVTLLVDRHPHRRTWPRFVELALLWILVWGGVFGLLGVMGHIGPQSVETAESIGYAPSMFQWEVGFGDLTLCVLGIAAFWFRDRWLSAAVVAVAVSFGGDAIGHIMQWNDGNLAVNNVWAIPSDLVQAAAGVILWLLYRRGLGRLPTMPKHGVVPVEG